MNIYLLDTHVLIWWISQVEELSPFVYELIKNKENTILISAASVWEIGIKQALGKLYVSDDLLSDIKKLGFEVLNISAQHADCAAKLPLYHRDPFDRILIAQANVEQIPLLSADSIFKRYMPFPLIQI